MIRIRGRMKLFLGTVLIDEQFYASKTRRDKVLKLWESFITDRHNKFYIHYKPQPKGHAGGQIKQIPLYVPKNDPVNAEFDRLLKLESNNNDMRGVITKEQEEIIRRNILKLKPKELAEKANVNIKIIYERRRSRGGWIEDDTPPVEVKKERVRPPAQYSNQRWYDQL